MIGKSDFDEEFAAKIIGKKVLVGLTYLDQEGNLIEQQQFCGEVIRANFSEGILFRRLDSGKEFKLPPDLRGFTEAAAGEYRLRTTGEVVVDPDYTVTWTINKPPPSST